MFGTSGLKLIRLDEAPTHLLSSRVNYTTPFHSKMFELHLSSFLC